MAGYSHAMETENCSEKVLWYLIIAVFGVVTSYNIYTIILGRYVRNEAQIRSNPATAIPPNIILPNMSVNLHLPLLILSDYKLSLPYNGKSETELGKKSETELLAIINNDIPAKDEYALMLQKWNKNRRVIEQYEQTVARKWLQLEKLTANRYSHTREEIQEKLPKLLNEISGLQYNDVIYNMLVLDSIEKGTKPGEQLGLLSTQGAQQVLVRLNCTLKELVVDTKSKLARVLHVEGADSHLMAMNFDDMAMGYFTISVQLNFRRKMEQGMVLRLNIPMVKWLRQLMDYRDNFVHYDFFALITGMLTYDVEQIPLHFYRISLAEFLTTNADHLNSIIHSPGYYAEYAAHLNWIYRSVKNRCSDGTFEWCMSRCLVESYKSVCGCIPWSLHYLDPSAVLCVQRCNNEQTNQCDETCANQFCDRYGIEFRVLRNWKNFTESLHISFIMPPTLHIEFAEEYESLGAIVAKVGSLLDFWIGVNMMAVTHLLGYLVKNILNKITSAKGTTRKKHVKNLQELHKSVLCLLSRAEALNKSANRGKELRKKSRWRWLQKSAFFRTTKITGFGFIAAAKSCKETILWSILILTFLIITVWNVCSAVNEYLAKPTVTAATLSNGTELEFGNLTFSLPLSLVALSDIFPTPLRYYYKDPKFLMPVSEWYACFLMDIWRDTEILTRESLLAKWLDFENWSLDVWQERGSKDYTSSKNWNRWTAILERSSADLKDFLEHHQETQLDSSPNDQRLYEKLLGLLDAPLKELNPSEGLLLLRALNAGGDPQQELFDLIKTTHHNLQLEDFEKPAGKSIQQLMAGYRGEELFGMAQKLLSNVIHIKVSGEPGAKIVLTHLDYVVTDEDRQEDSNTLSKLRLQFLLSLPQNTQRSQLEIEIFSFVDIWHKYVLDIFYDHFERTNRTQYKLCGSSYNISGFIHEEELSYKSRVVTLGFPFDFPLYLGTEYGDRIWCDLLQHTEIVFTPTVSFQSNIVNCTTQSAEECVDECTISVCGCQPWTKLYLGQRAQVCTAPCLIDRECYSKCEKDLSHPCNTVLYMATLGFQKRYQTLKDTTALYSIRITKTAKRRIGYTVSQDSFGSLVIQLSGLLDLWLGINFFSIIHLGLYIIKRAIHSFKSSSTKEANSNCSVGLVEQIELLRKATEREIRKHNTKKRKPKRLP